MNIGDYCYDQYLKTALVEFKNNQLSIELIAEIELKNSISF